MRSKREILEMLDRERLQAVVDRAKVEVSDRRAKASLVDAVDKVPTVTALTILEEQGRDDLKGICRRLGLDDGGREKADLIERIMGDGAKASAPAQTWIGFPEIAPSRAADAAAPPPDSAASNGDAALTVEVEPRKPRLAWQGMSRKEIATAVPTQVVEIVRPGRAIDRGDELAGLATRQVTARDVTMLPPNRLIWTNDNLVALQTLLDERDPGTHDYRYRGKVDLVYIDPPFMVNNDFRADNAIDIELDDDVQAKKEPSLVEIARRRRYPGDCGVPGGGGVIAPTGSRKRTGTPAPRGVETGDARLKFLTPASEIRCCSRWMSRKADWVVLATR